MGDRMSKILVTVFLTVEFADEDDEAETVLDDIMADIIDPLSYAWQPDGWRVWGMRRSEDVISA